mgnify:FL=1
MSEFALHARAILGLPITQEHVALSIPQGTVAASHAIVVQGDGEAEFRNVAAALAEPGTDLRIFAKPEVHGHRRMAVALAIGGNEADARAKPGTWPNRSTSQSFDAIAGMLRRGCRNAPKSRAIVASRWYLVNRQVHQTIYLPHTRKGE